MPKRRPQFAKLAWPRLYKVMLKDRLFQPLDEKRDRPVVWIIGRHGPARRRLRKLSRGSRFSRRFRSRATIRGTQRGQ